MIPKGSAWQYLRQAALSAIPQDTSVSPTQPVSLMQWQANGYYRVLRSSSSGFELEVPSIDLGNALLTDTEHLLDAAIEHQALIWKSVNDQAWVSPAWLAVTNYYWAFFLVLALSRLLGRSTWYLGPTPADTFARVATTCSARPGQGCYRLEVGPTTSATERSVSLRKRSSRMHDETWRTWGRLCDQELVPLLAGTANSAEDRLFTAIVRANNVLGPEWPSSFRNAVNYRQGFAYSSVRRIRVLAPYSYLRAPLTYEFEEVLDLFESRASNVRRGEIESDPDGIARLLIQYAFVLHTLVVDLHSEVVERRGIDIRWRNARWRFAEQNALLSAEGMWPT